MQEQIIALMRQGMAQAEIVDLSYTLEPGMPVWPTHARFGAVVYETYEEGFVSMHRQLTFGEHTGTHLDAPKHFFRDGASIEEVSTESVIGRGVLIDASFLEPRGIYTLDMLKKFEEENGAVEEGDIILMHFGWEEKYGIGREGSGFLQDWPGLGEDAARYLLEKGAASVGTDALSLDAFGSESYPCHNVLLENGVPIIENLTNLRKLPVFSFVIGLADKIKDGSASPLRIIAFIQRGEGE